jgi:DNA-binding NarL/FixJ family response regulator
MGSVSVLVVADYETVRAGLKVILDADAGFDVVAETADGQTAVARAAHLHPDLVLMDASMPVLDALWAISTIRRDTPRIKVLVLSPHTDRASVRRMFAAGATGYVLKQSPAAELLRASHLVAGGETYVDLAIAPETTGPASVEGEPQLSPREEEVLRLVALGYSNKEIASQLGLSVKTVETHKANVAAKLGLRKRFDIVRFALRRGWLEGV